MFDPTHAREEEIFTRLGYIDRQYLRRGLCGVLMGTGLMDTVCPPSTQFAARKITSPKEPSATGFGHEGLPGFTDRAFRFMTNWYHRRELGNKKGAVT